jgi:hypothetical protein
VTASTYWKKQLAFKIMIHLGQRFSKKTDFLLAYQSSFVFVLVQFAEEEFKEWRVRHRHGREGRLDHPAVLRGCVKGDGMRDSMANTKYSFWDAISHIGEKHSNIFRGRAIL